jgi:DNA-binding FadR family transcriptional regulator
MAQTTKPEEASTSTLSRELTTRLLRRIIDGVYPAGSKLPTERVLAEEFGVARTVVREALKRIEAYGMLTIRQGSGALVEDFQTVGGIELADLLIVRNDGSIDEEFVEDIGRLHENLHVWLTKLGALNSTREEIEELKRLLRERAALPKDDDGRRSLTFEITRRIFQASHNRYLQLLFNTLARTTRTSRTIFELPVHFDPGIQIFFERLVEAFEARDPEMAGLLTARVFEAHLGAFLKAMGNGSLRGETEEDR